MFVIEQLIESAKEGDQESIIQIINKYKPFILKKASGYHIPGYDFEDLVQHGYLSVIKAIKMYKLFSNSYNGYFLNSISTNFAALLKSKIKHFREIPDDNILNKNGTYEFTIEDEVIAYDEVIKLYKALDKLDPMEKEILERFFINHETFKEIACANKLKYVRTTYIKNLALEKLKNILDK